MVIIIIIHNVIVTQFSSWLFSTGKSSDKKRRAAGRTTTNACKTNALQIKSERKSAFKTFKLKLILTTVYCAPNLWPFSQHFIAVIRRLPSHHCLYLVCLLLASLIFYLHNFLSRIYSVCTVCCVNGEWSASMWSHEMNFRENLFRVMNVVEIIW